MADTNIIGISALFHDSACCLVQDGRLVAAAQEERFTRQKHEARMPGSAFRYCLEEGRTTIAQVDCVAYYEMPVEKLARQMWMGLPGPPKGSGASLARLDPTRPEREIREQLGYDGRLEFVRHHEAHAASSFYFSGFPEAAILTVDSVGEWATTTYGRASRADMDLFEEVHFPDSLGMLYSTITSYLGFSVNNGEYKVMGLAPYGDGRYVEEIRQMVHVGPEGQFELQMEYFEFLGGRRMFSSALVDLLGRPPRVPGSKIGRFHQDVASSLQRVLEEILLAKVRYLHTRVPSENLCMAGGVALNCVANGRILREGPFERLFVQPAANDAGGALGAAALAHRRVTGARVRRNPLRDARLGPAYSSDEIHRTLDGSLLPVRDFRGREPALLRATAHRLAEGKVVGWFHGRMEFGPRALGARSILADPRDPGMRDRINSLVKKREGFRPFAPVVLESKLREHFDLDVASPFMLLVCQVASPLPLPAITHVDGSARVQTVDETGNPRLAALLQEFDAQTGCPILLNTSFNMRGQPIVCSPVDAIQTFLTAGLDCLVLEDLMIDRWDIDEDVLAGIEAMIPATNREPREVILDVYTL